MKYLEDFNTSLSRIMSNKNAHVLVGGDFNCGDIEWSTMQVPEGVPKRPVQTKLVSIIQDHCLSQMVSIHTEKTRPLIYCLQTHHPQLTVLKGCPRSAKQITTLSMLSTTLRLNGSSRPRVRSFYTNERTWTVYMTIWRA